MAIWDRLRENICTALSERICSLYGQAPERVVMEQPPNTEMGDLATPVCFELARVLKKAPRQIAQEVVDSFDALPPGCSSMAVAGAGYINVFFNRNSFVAELNQALQAGPPEPDGSAPAAIVEHTNINPNKAAHIGHLRNAVLGDTLVRALRSLGRPVEVQNYIDNTGVQVADVVIGFRELEGVTTLQELEGVAQPFDFSCWDVYSRVVAYYESRGEEAKVLRSTTLRQIEEGEGETAAMAAAIAERNVRRHVATMERIGVAYDLLPWEGEIIRLQFWQKAFDLLRERGAAVLEQEGKNAGCWVMPLKQSEAFAEMEDPDKVLVRSDGTVTYVGKDVAYQLWKFGLLGADFSYARFHRYPDGHQLWATRPDGVPGDEAPSFGNAGVVYNVIDVRQAYLQRVVAEGLRVLGYAEQADRSIHFSYEFVALSPNTARELGLPVADADADRQFVEMSGRKGLGVKADDLLDHLEEKAGREVAQRNPNLPPATQRETARIIACGALRFFMLKFTRNKVIIFDLDEAMSFEGEAGPYVQYAAVRAGNILGKLGGFDAGQAERAAAGYDMGLLSAAEQTDTWELLHLLSQGEDVTASAVEALELSQVARHAFTLAQRFNGYYHKYHIISEDDPRLREMRALLVRLFRGRMEQVLAVLGIGIPERM
jgi:arginyl-tRNA synthetase